MNKLNPAVTIFKWLRNEREVIIKIYFLAILQGALYLLMPLGIQGIITYIMAGSFSASLVLLSTITILAVFYIGVLQLWQMRINETLQERIFAQITDRWSRLISKSQEETLRYKVAHFLEVTTLQKGISKILLDFSFSVISILFGLLILPAYNTWFLLFVILLGGAFYVLVIYFSRNAIDENLKTSTQKYYLLEWFTRSFNTDQPEQGQRRTDELLTSYLRHRKSYFSNIEKQYKGILIFKVVFVSVLIFLGAFLVHLGELNIGQFVASEIIILLVVNGVEKLVGSLDTFYDIITGLEKIERTLSGTPSTSFLNSEYHPVLKSHSEIYSHPYSRRIKRVIAIMLVIASVVLIAPWTQNVEMHGKVTVLDPEQKPQNVTSRISGRVEKWFINDGQLVKKNDTIAFISEIKEDYIDPLLVQRSEAQVRSKEFSVKSYEEKINAIDFQIDALNKSLTIKTGQLRNKVLQSRAKLASDSADLMAAINNYKITEEQFKRYEDLLVKGVISKTDFENRKVKMQEAYAKRVSAENKMVNARNDLNNAELELGSVQQEYREKLMKAESDKYATISSLYDAEGALTKLQNQLSNYSMRRSFYYVTAPQDGYIHNVAISGVGEIIKEGGILCDIVPLMRDQVVELYVEPVDLPLIDTGRTIQLVFDGWPVFAFSGWPGLSYGTFSAEVITFDKVISNNGKFRVLARNSGERWPSAIQMGGGVRGFALLKDVPLIYELWRQVNGFPPEFYKETYSSTNKHKK